MTLNPLDKLIITNNSKRVNGRVIGIKKGQDNSVVYIIEPLRVDFGRFKNGSRLMVVSSTEIENNKVFVEKHST